MKRVNLEGHTRYFATEDGEIFSKITNRYLCCKGDKNGYLRVGLTSDDGVLKTHKIHRLILLTFKPIPNASEMVVNHIDGVKSNNHVSNLEWSTTVENIRHAFDTGLRTSTPAGVSSKKARFGSKELERVYDLKLKGCNNTEIAKELKTTRDVVSTIIRGVRYVEDFRERREKLIALGKVSRRQNEV